MGGVGLTPRVLELSLDMTRCRSWGKALLAGLLIFSLGLISVASASPSLHKRLHADWDQDHHQCSVSCFQKHQALASDPAPAAVACDGGQPMGLVFFHITAPASAALEFSQSRAPPAAFSSHV